MLSSSQQLSELMALCQKFMEYLVSFEHLERPQEFYVKVAKAFAAEDVHQLMSFALCSHERCCLAQVWAKSDLIGFDMGCVRQESMPSGGASLPVYFARWFFYLYIGQECLDL